MSSAQFEKYINNYLIDNYSLDTPFYFMNGVYSDTFDLPPSWIDLSTRAASAKPSDIPYLSYRIVDGVTINKSLGGGNQIIKGENVSLEFTIIRPKNTSKKQTNIIEAELDTLFLNKTFAEVGFEILVDSNNPKTTVNIPATGDDIDGIKQLQYRFDYRFL